MKIIIMKIVIACAAATWLLSSAASPRFIIPLIYRRSLFHRLTALKPKHPLLLPQAKRFSTKLNDVALDVDLQFEAPLKIVEYPNPILRAKNKRIETFGDNLKKLVDEMFYVMYKTDGIGLSAPQAGLSLKLMVFNPVGEQGEGEEIVLINTKVSSYSKKVVLFNEGCLSFPGIYADVKRPESVKIDAQDINGARFTVRLSSLPARVFQHEFDHLQGVLFFDRMTEEVLDTIRNELQKYEDKTGQPSPEKVEDLKVKSALLGDPEHDGEILGSVPFLLESCW